jgi:hypothetical protein
MEGAKGKGGGRYWLQTLYAGNTATKNAVGIVLDKSLRGGVVDIKEIGLF